MTTITTATITYTLDGGIEAVDETGLSWAIGHFDADGETWEDEVKAIAAAAGWTTTGRWVAVAGSYDSQITATRSDETGHGSIAPFHVAADFALPAS